MSSKYFEVLVINSSNTTKADNAKDILYSFRSFSKLWISPSLDEQKLLIQESNFELHISDKVSESEKKSGVTTAKPYLVTLSGKYEEVESRRLMILEFLKDQSFDYRYVVKDDISQDIAEKLYPYLYKLENSLRGYLTKFMAVKIGPSWWSMNASSDMSEKAKMRKGNEKVFGKLISNDAFLIDFDDLGELVYEQSSGFRTKDDVANRVINLPENIDDLKKLKEELRSNYQKYFEEFFAQKNFKELWREWTLLRNKIAHSNLFTQSDLDRGMEVAKLLLEIIKTADESSSTFAISLEEKDAIQEQAIARAEAIDFSTNEAISLNTDSAESPSKVVSLPEQIKLSQSDTLRKISVNEFINELQKLERQYKTHPNGFVGLKRFIQFHLPDLGYDYSDIKTKLQELLDSKAVEIYYVTNPYNPIQNTAALKTPELPKNPVISESVAKQIS